MATPTMLCPFHLVPLVRRGKRWVCPFPGCPYQRLACPHCGFIIRILPGTSFCLYCGAKFTVGQVAVLYAEAFGVPLSEARQAVSEIASRYLRTED